MNVTSSFALVFNRIANEKITACLSANRHGLCVGGSYMPYQNVFIVKNYYQFHSFIAARGNISHNSSGALVALLDQAQQLNPDANPPVVALETAKKYFNFIIETQSIETFIRNFSFQCLSHSQAWIDWCYCP